MNKKTKWISFLQSCGFYSLLLLISALFLLVFSNFTSPLYPGWHGPDSSAFIITGRGIKYGLLPYRDFFDQKGPYLYFIQYIGQLIADGRTGSFIMQVINLFIILLISCRIYDLVDHKKRLVPKLLLLIPVLFYISGTLEQGNLTEEFSNSFVFISLYYCFKHLTATTQNEAHPPFYSFVYGICIGFISFIRIDNGILVFAIVLTFLIFEIKGNRYKNILYNLALGFAGIILAWLPMLILYASAGELGNMLYQTFIFAFKYLKNSNNASKIYFYLIPLFLIPAFCGFFAKDKNRPKIRLLGFIVSIMYILYFYTHNQYLHYFQTALPLPMIGIWFFIFAVNCGCITLDKKKILSAAASVFIVISFLPVIRMSYPNFRVIRERTTTDLTKNEIKAANEIKEMIPVHDRKSVLGYQISPYWYAITEIFPCNKYYAWQEEYAGFDLSIAEEINTMFIENPPLYIVIWANNTYKNTDITVQLQEKYIQYYTNGVYELYKLI